MASPRACSQCLRVLGRQTRKDRAVAVFDTTSRAFMSQSRLLQQASPPRDPQPEVPSVPPTTTSTITSNITAQTTPSKSTSPTRKPSSSASAQNAPSTAEIQRVLSSNLSTGPSLPTALATRLRQSATKTTDPYITYGVSQSLFQTCSLQANYTIPESQRQGILTGSGPPKTSEGEDLGLADTEGLGPGRESWWFGELGMPASFSTWSQVTYLHMYILVVRLRALQSSRDNVFKYQQYLLDHFSHAAEEKMLLLHGMSARGIRNRYLKDLFVQWRGALTAYDEGLVKGDAVLAGAVWRNLWKGTEEVDWVKVAGVVAFVRRAVGLLGQVADERVQEVVVEAGLFEKAMLGVREQVGRESRGIKEILSREEEVVAGSP